MAGEKNSVTAVQASPHFTPEEAAAYARVSRSLIYQWVDERRLAHLRLGGEGKGGGNLPPRQGRGFSFSVSTMAGEKNSVTAVQASPHFTPEEAAAYARVSRSLIYQWVDERRLAHLRLGGKGKRGRILIHVKDLDQFLEAQKV